jgi:hypothetical protein
MAYTGGIDYLQSDFGNFDWEDLQFPCSSEAPTSISSTDPHATNMVLVATAREVDLGATVQGEGELIFDTPRGSTQP